LKQSAAEMTGPEPIKGATAETQFNVTLRRADNVPLGLEVRSDDGTPHLMVEGVRPGGTVEAWNRQCAGDVKEIRPGDVILQINGAEDADSMREECQARYLLKMKVKRRTLPSMSLRADAKEFVPGVV